MTLGERVAAFAHGFLEETNQDISLPDITAGATGTVDDLADYASLDMIEASKQADSGEGESEAEPVRTIDGALDFLGHVATSAVEEAVEFVEREFGDGHAQKERDESPMLLHQLLIGTGSWSPKRFSVGSQEQVARQNSKRRAVRFVNLGPEVIQLRSDTAGNTSPNYWSVPISKLDGTAPYNPVEIPTCDEIWAYPTTTGTVSILEVMDVFGDPR